MRKFRVWFNLHLKVWTVKAGRDPVRHAAAVVLGNVRFHVGEGGRARVLARQCREVHAWAIGDLLPDGAELPADAVEITYNPYRAGTFTRRDNGLPVVSAEVVFFCADRRAYAVNPRG